MNKKPFPSCMVAFTAATLLAWSQTAAMAAGTGASVTNTRSAVNLDLTSSTASVAASKLVSGAVINVGGTTQTVHQGQLLTPAELVAAMQIVRGGTQSLLLNANGAAVGGSFAINSQLGALSGLVVPHNVTAVDGGTRLNIGGSLVDMGHIVAAGNAQSLVGISATNIDVAATGAVSTATPLNLTLAALSDITNNGSISSLGKLWLTAGGGINNTGTISGVNGVSLFAGNGNITNSGTVSSYAGNVQLSTAPNVDLTVNNAGGLLQATLGTVAFNLANGGRGKLTQLNGGDVEAEDIDFTGSHRKLSIDVHSLEGLLNITACSSHVVVASGNPQLGTMHITGDPTFINTGGSWTIAANQSVASGQAFTVIALTDIDEGPGLSSIDTSSKTGKGGDVTLLAGFTSTHVAGGNDTITNVNATGDINLAGVNINTSSTKSDAGAVQLISANGDVSIGNINASAASGAGGKVTIQAGGASITTGNINSSGKSGGNLLAASDQVLLVNSPAYNDTTGAFVAGSGSFALGSLIAGSTLTTGDVNASAKKGNGGDITAITDQLLQMGALTSTGTTNGGAVALVSNSDKIQTKQVNISATAGAGGTFATSSADRTTILGLLSEGTTHGGSVDMISTNGAVFFRGDLNITGKDNSAQHINIDTTANGNIIFTKGSIIADGKSGGGASITLNAKDNINVEGTVSSKGTTKGGNITLVSATSAVDVLGDVSNKAGDNTGQAIIIGSIGSAFPVLIGGSVDSSGTAKNGSGGDVTLVANDRLRVGGSVNSTGKASGGNITLVSLTKGMTIIGGINDSAATNAAKTINLSAVNEIEVGKDIQSTGSVSGGTVTITSTNGDVRLGVNGIDQNKLGTTALILTKAGGINVSSSGGTPGTVTVKTTTAGEILIGKDVNASGVTSTAGSGKVDIESQDLLLVGGKVTTTSKKGTGGNVTLFSQDLTNGGTLFGTDVGAISTNGATGGGRALLLADNGMILVRGAINSSATTGAAGSVLGLSLFDTNVLGPITATGTQTNILPTVSFSAGSNLGALIGGAKLTINGAINTTVKGHAGGAVGLIGRSGVNVTGNITTNGTAGGSVNLESEEGLIGISGNINTSATNAVGGAGGAGGPVNFDVTTVGAGAFVKGNIITRGGNSSGTGAAAGGQGGAVVIRTAIDTLGNSVGSVLVGSIDTRGGSTTSTGASGGSGGNVTVSAATLQLMNSSAAGASVNAEGGVNGNKAIQDGGAIVISTFGTQPVPANLDLTSTKKTEFALPGGMFAIGNTQANGTSGILISSKSNTLDSLGKNAYSNANTQSPKLQVTLHEFLNSTLFDEGNQTNITIKSTTTPGGSIRTMITPAEALALYQTTRNIPQTFGLTSKGVADDHEDQNAAVLNNINIQMPQDFAKQFTAFNISTVTLNPPNPTLLFVVTENDTNPTLSFSLPQSKAASVSQNLVFADFGVIPGYVNVQMGSQPLTVASGNGRIDTNQVSQVLRFADSGKLQLLLNGDIDGNNLVFQAPKDVTITAGVHSILTPFTSFQTSGALGLEMPTGSFNYLALGPTALFTTTPFSLFYDKNLTIGPAAKGLGSPNVTLGFQSMQTFGTVNINISNNVDMTGLGHIDSVGNVNINVNDFVVGFAAVRVTSLASVSINAFNTIASLSSLNLTAGTNVSLVAGNTIEDLGNQWIVNAIKGNLTVGTNGNKINGQAPQINLTFATAFDEDNFNAGKDVMVYGKGLGAINGFGQFVAKGNMFVGSVPKLGIINNAINDLAGIYVGKNSATLEVGTGSHTTLDGQIDSNGLTKALFHGSAAFTTGTNAQMVGHGLTILSDGDLTFGDGVELGDQGAIIIKAGGQITFGNNPFIRGGQEDINAPTHLPISKDFIINTGSIDIEGNLGVTFGKFTVPNAVDLISVGGDITIKSSIGAVTLGNQDAFEALGGNIVILGKSGVTGGAAIPATSPGNTFIATSLDSGKGVTGGGVEIRGGTTVSTIKVALATRPFPFVLALDPSQLPTAVFTAIPPFQKTKGEISVGSTTGVTLLATELGVGSIFVNGQNPVIQISGTTTGIVTLDSVQITSATPIANVQAQHGENELVVDTALDDEPDFLVLK